MEWYTRYHRAHEDALYWVEAARKLQQERDDLKAERDRLLSPEIMQRALQAAWDDFCGDTGCFPDCFEWRGRKLYADFSRGNFARMVSAALALDKPQDHERSDG